MTDIFAFFEKYGITPRFGGSYKFDDITQAMIDMDQHKVNGKIVEGM